MLHLVALGSEDSALLAQMLALVAPGDDVVFLDRGLTLPGDAALMAQLGHCRCHAWGTLPDHAPAAVIPQIDANGVVALSEEHRTSLSWFPEVE